MMKIGGGGSKKEEIQKRVISTAMIKKMCFKGFNFVKKTLNS